MMPQLILLLILVIVVVPLAVAKLVLDYRAKEERRSSGVTLTVEELERLIRRYVDDATTPLQERIRELEEAVDTDRDRSKSRTRPSDEPLIDDPTLEGENLRIDESESGSATGVT